MLWSLAPHHGWRFQSNGAVLHASETDAALHDAAVEEDRRRCHVVVAAGGEEDDDIGDVVGLCQATERDRVLQLLQLRGVVHRGLVDRRRDRFRADGDHTDPVRAELDAGVTMRRGGPSAHPASTQQILELRDQGLTWNEVATQVDMTVLGAWSRYRRARPPKSPRLGRWQQVLADALDQNLAIGVRAAIADHLGRAPTRAELTAARRAAHSLSALGRARVFYVPGGDVDDDAGDRNYLVLAKPNVIMNDIRLRGLAVGGSEAASRKNPHNHAQTARNLRRSLLNAAAGARLIQAEGLDSESAADVAASLADALEELHRLQRSLDRRIRRDQGRSHGVRGI